MQRQRLITVFTLFSALSTLPGNARAAKGDAAPWRGVYHHGTKRGFAVEFSGSNYAVRTHDGGATTDGIVGIVDGAREVRACCTSFRFRAGDDGTLVDQHTNTWHRAAPAWPLQKLRRAPLTVRVVDGETRRPVTGYSYEYRLSAPQGKEYPPWVLARAVTNASGSFTIEAPLSCELGLEIDALDYLCHGSGYGYYAFDITSTNTERVVTVHLPRGLTVEGRVVDADTGKPVSNAMVAPLIEYHPSESPNEHRQVATGKEGRFVVHAVSEWRGISVDHRRYGETEHRNAKDWPQVAGDPLRRRKEIRISEAARIAGIVTDSEGNPLADARIESYNGRRAGTDREGRFEVYGATGRLMVEAPGFLDGEVPIPPPASTNLNVALKSLADREAAIAKTIADLKIVLERKYRVHGEVVDPEGNPVPRFSLAMLEEYGTCRETVRNARGLFLLELEGPVTNLVAVSADGYALTHAPMLLTRPETRLTVALQRGVTVSGTVRFPPGHEGGATVSLVPQCEGRFWRGREDEAGWVEEDEILVFGMERKTGCAAELGTRSARVLPDGSYRVAHVAPGSYTLSVSGKGLESASRTVRIPPEGRNLPVLSVEGISPSLSGSGTITGRVFRPYRPRTDEPEAEPEPWAFADGEIRHRDSRDWDDTLRFKADEKGYYGVTNVPAGPVGVNASYNVTFDIIDALGATGTVRRGETTVIDVMPDWAEPPPPVRPGAAPVSVTIEIGDGSDGDRLRGWGATNGVTAPQKEKWLLRLVEAGASCEGRPWLSEIEVNDETVMAGFPDVPPGKYDLTLLSGRGWRRESLWATPKPVTVLPDKGADVAVHLPPHALRGRIMDSDTARWARVYVVGGGDARPVREVRCSRVGGAFVVPFVVPGKCQLYAYEDDAGWSHRGGIAVDGVCDIGSIRLRSGAKLSGQLLSDWTPVRDAGEYAVKAVHRASGIVLRDRLDSGDNGGRFAFDNLWPGEWRVILETGGRELVSTNVVLEGTTPVFVDLAWTE